MGSCRTPPTVTLRKSVKVRCRFVLWVCLLEILHKSPEQMGTLTEKYPSFSAHRKPIAATGTWDNRADWVLQNTSPGYNLGLDLKKTTTTKPYIWHKVRKGTIFTKPREFKLNQVRVQVYVDSKDLKAKDLAPSVKLKTNKKLLYQGKGSLGKTM